MPAGKKGKKKRRAGVAAGVAKSESSRSGAAPQCTASQKRKGTGDAVLDDIFAALAPKKAERKQEQDRAAAEAAAAEAAAEKVKKKEKREKLIDPVFGEEYDLDSIVNPQMAQVHRVDQRTGLNVFKAHHLGIGRGGYTPLCPFDCKCCY